MTLATNCGLPPIENRVANLRRFNSRMVTGPIVSGFYPSSHPKNANNVPKNVRRFVAVWRPGRAAFKPAYRASLTLLTSPITCRRTTSGRVGHAATTAAKSGSIVPFCASTVPDSVPQGVGGSSEAPTELGVGETGSIPAASTQADLREIASRLSCSCARHDATASRRTLSTGERKRTGN